MSVTTKQIDDLVAAILSKNKSLVQNSVFTCVLYDEIPTLSTAAANTLVQTSLREAVRQFLMEMNSGAYSAGKILASDVKRREVHRNY